MATYTYSAFKVVFPANEFDPPISFSNASAVSFSVIDGQTVIPYENIYSVDRDEFLAEPTGNFVGGIAFDGAPALDGLDAMFMDVVWDDNGTTRISQVAEFEIANGDGTFTAYYVFLGGDALPDFQTLAEFVAFDSQLISADNIATGPFSPVTGFDVSAVPGVQQTDDDLLLGSDGPDSIVGGIGNDSLVGFQGDDTLIGGPGDDYLNPGDNLYSYDLVMPGAGNDIVDLSDVMNGYVEISMRDLTGGISLSVDDWFTDFEIAKGLDGTTLVQDFTNATLADGLALTGSTGADYFDAVLDMGWISFKGLAGDDEFNLNDSSATFRLDYRDGAATSGATINLATGVVANDGFGDQDTINVGAGFSGSFELRGTDRADNIIGSSRDERFILQQGNDTLDAGGGFDVLRYNRAGVGSVTVDLTTNTATGTWNGQAFTHTVSNVEAVLGSLTEGSTLIANDQGILLQGGAGNDSLVGGAAADLFIYTGGADTISALGNFESGDIVDVSRLGLGSSTLMSAIAGATDTAGGARIDFGNGNTLTLAGVAASAVPELNFFTGGTATVTGTTYSIDGFFTVWTGPIESEELTGFGPGTIGIAVKNGSPGPILAEFTDEFGDTYLSLTNPEDIMLFLDGQEVPLAQTSFGIVDVHWTDASSASRTTTILEIDGYNVGVGSYIAVIAGDALPFSYTDSAAFLAFAQNIGPGDFGPPTDPNLQPGNPIDLALYADTSVFYYGGFTNTAIGGGGGGGTGNLIEGGFGADNLNGTDGDDDIRAYDGNDLVFGSLGDDTIDGGWDYDGLIYDGTTGVDGVFINNTDSLINESYRGMSLSVGARNVFKFWNTTLEGADLISGFEGFNGTQHGDVIYLGDEGQYVYDRGGDDKLVAGDYPYSGVTFFAGSGDDTFYGSMWADKLSFQDDGWDVAGGQTQGINLVFNDGLSADGTVVDPWGGLDRFYDIENVDGTNLGDYIEGSDIDNMFLGYGGNDTIYGQGGSDTIMGNDGNDYLNPGDNNGNGDNIAAGTGNDTIEFDDGVIGYFHIAHYDLYDDGITVNIDGNANTGSIDKGLDGTTTLINIAAPIMAGADVGGLGVEGTWYDDVFNITSADGGWMQVMGAAGNDLFNIGASTGALRLNYGGHNWNGIVANLATGIISEDGTGGQDTITGSGHVTELRATMFDDSIIGSDNNESFILLGGDDILDGGGGFDRLRFDRDFVSAVTVNLEAGTAQGTWFNQFFDATISNIEWVRGTREFGDQLIGDSADNRLQGMGGNDTLDGGVGGNDTLEGGTGSDTFVYQGGIDVIVDYDTLFDQVQLDLPGFTDQQIQAAFAGAVDNGLGAIVVTFDASNKLIFNGALLEDVQAIVPSDGPFIPTAPVRPPAWTVGDPHLQTLDGVGYDFHAVGEYVLLRGKAGGVLDGIFEVQSRMAKVAGVDGVSVNEAVAVNLDGRTVMIDAADANPVWIDGTNTSVADGATVVLGDHLLTRSGSDYTIYYAGSNDLLENGDAQVIVSVRTGRIDIAVAASDEMAGAVEGLLGDGDGNTANDIALADGTVLLRPLAYEDLYGQYRDDWRVTTEAQSLFTYDAGETLAGFYDPDAPGQTIGLEDFDQATKDAAKAQVEASGLQPGTLAYDNALLDYLLTGDTEFIDSSADPDVQNPDAAPVQKLDIGQGRVALSVTLTNAAGTPIADARVGFTADGQTSAFLASAGATVGDYVVGLGQGTGGAVSAEKAYDPTGPQKIQVSDALTALRLSLGLNPSYGAADAFDFLQADVDQNGRVQVADALSILRISLGLQDAPGWTFIDANADLSGVTRNAVPVFSGLDLDPLTADADVELTGILLGNIDNFDFV